MMDRRVVVGGLATSVLVLSTFAARADDWPERPVRIVVPFSAAGAADMFGRFYADALSNAFGKQFYVENKVGAGGMIASEEVARAKPDGYTLMVSGIPTHVLGPAMNKNISFDTMRDFIAGHVKIGMLTYSSVSEHVRSGALLPLVVSASARLPQLPNVPTFPELGYPELVATTWFGLSGPAGLPPDIVARINHEVVNAMGRPQMRKLMNQDAIETKAMSPAEVTQYFQSEIDKWQPIIARIMTAK
jgi:tripartite-type tricarboxylate transporter receptor subunit TctC